MAQTSLKIRGWWVALPLVGLLTLGGLIATDPGLSVWDANVLLGLHRYATPTFTRIITVVTDLGTFWGVLPVTVLLILLALQQRQWPAASYLALVMGGSAVLNLSAKLLGHRVRPALWDGVPLQGDFSFPSGHATYSMTLVLALILLHWHSPKRLWLIGFGAIFVLGIGLSRVYLGVHYPSDIVGGWLLAIAWAVGLYGILGRWIPLR